MRCGEKIRGHRLIGYMVIPLKPPSSLWIYFFYLRPGRTYFTYFSSLTVFLCYGAHLGLFSSGAEVFLSSPLCNSSSED